MSAVSESMAPRERKRRRRLTAPAIRRVRERSIDRPHRSLNARSSCGVRATLARTPVSGVLGTCSPFLLFAYGVS
jgi:hypothetical protein